MTGICSIGTRIRFSPAWRIVMSRPLESKIIEFWGRTGMVGRSWGSRRWGSEHAEATNAAARADAASRGHARNRVRARRGAGDPEGGKARIALLIHRHRGPRSAAR